LIFQDDDVPLFDKTVIILDNFLVDINRNAYRAYRMSMFDHLTMTNESLTVV